MNEKTIDEADEDVLSREVSDDALETAGGAAEGRPQVPSATRDIADYFPCASQWP
jgi:hypothetical protein